MNNDSKKFPRCGERSDSWKLFCWNCDHAFNGQSEDTSIDCKGCIHLDVFSDHGCITVANCMLLRRKVNEWGPDEQPPRLHPLRSNCKEEPPEAA